MATHCKLRDNECISVSSSICLCIHIAIFLSRQCEALQEISKA
eukprot:jgi/Antlo1/2178/1316